MTAILGDISMTCGHCYSSFLFSAKEQELYRARNFQNPKICSNCRASRKRERLKKEERNSSNKNYDDENDRSGDFSSAVIDLIKRKRKMQDDVDDDDLERGTSNAKVRRTESAQGKEKEVDPHKIETRLKQIQYGYNTVAYDNYVAQVPKAHRNQNYDEHPRTPDPYVKQSKRAFDGRVRKWRRELHRWDIKEGCEGEIGAEAGVAGKKSPEKMSRTHTLKLNEVQQQEMMKISDNKDEKLTNEGEIEVDDFGNDDVFNSEDVGFDNHNDNEEDDDDIL